MLDSSLFIQRLVVTGSIVILFNGYILLNILRQSRKSGWGRNNLISFFIVCLVVFLTILQIFSLVHNTFRNRVCLYIFIILFLLVRLTITILYFNRLNFLTNNRQDIYIFRFFLIFIAYLPLMNYLYDDSLLSVCGLFHFFLYINLLCSSIFLIIWIVISKKKFPILKKYGLFLDTVFVSMCTLVSVLLTSGNLLLNEQNTSLSIAILIVALFFPNLTISGTVFFINLIGNRVLQGEELQDTAQHFFEKTGIRLTPREDEIMKYLLAGNSSKEIAYILSLSARTVEKHIENIYAKFKVKSRIDLLSQFQTVPHHSYVNRLDYYSKN